MPVKLNDSGNPVAWSKDPRCEGDDIPLPPGDLVGDAKSRARWDADAEEWVADPDYQPVPEYIVRRTSDTDYQLEDTTGDVLLSTTYQSEPTAAELSEDIVTYAESNGDAALHELRKMMLVGYRYMDDRS